METNSSRCSRSEKVSRSQVDKECVHSNCKEWTSSANNSLGLEVLCLEDQKVFALLKACRSGRLILWAWGMAFCLINITADRCLATVSLRVASGDSE